MHRQLTRTREDGTLYVRPDEIEKKLGAVLELDRDTLQRRFHILDRRDVEYVPSECIIYLLREAMLDNRSTWFETVYKALFKRCALRLQFKVSKGLFRDADTVREEIMGQFALCLAKGLQPGSDALDAMEVAFDKVFAGIRIAVVRKEFRREGLQDTFDPMPKDSDEADRLILSLRADDGSEVVGLWGAEYIVFRNSMFDAIYNLPAQEREAIMLRLNGWQIHSDDPDTPSIARHFNVDEGTIRYRISQGVKKVVAMTHGSER